MGRSGSEGASVSLEIPRSHHASRFFHLVVDSEFPSPKYARRRRADDHPVQEAGDQRGPRPGPGGDPPVQGHQERLLRVPRVHQEADQGLRGHFQQVNHSTYITYGEGASSNSRVELALVIKTFLGNRPNWGGKLKPENGATYSPSVRPMHPL